MTIDKEIISIALNDVSVLWKIFIVFSFFSLVISQFSLNFRVFNTHFIYSFISFHLADYRF